MEHLGFRNVRRHVQIQQVARRAVGLVARAEAVPPAPFRPHGQELLRHQVRQRLSV